MHRQHIIKEGSSKHMQAMFSNHQISKKSEIEFLIALRFYHVLVPPTGFYSKVYARGAFVRDHS